MSRGPTEGDRDSDAEGEAASWENALHSQRARPRRTHRALVALRLLAPAAAALALVSVITDDVGIDHDLLLTAPLRAQPGASIPLRALLYAGLNKPEGPVLVHGKTRVELRATGGKVLAQTTLRPGFGPSLEGELRVPSGAQGKLLIVARTQAGQERVEVERALTIGASEPANLGPRALGPLQQLAHGSLRIQGGPSADSPSTRSALTLRAAGGACAPELPCELLVYVGELGDPAAPLEVASTPSVTVEAAPRAAVSSSFVAVRVRTHGPEGNLELRRGSAARAVRLPVALGADAMALESAVLAPSAVPKARLLGENARGIADLFAEGHWSSSTTVRGAAHAPLAPSALPPGIYRAQLRRDPFESESAAVRSFYVRGQDESERDVLRALAQRVVTRDRARKPDERDTLAAQLARHDDDTSATLAATSFAATSAYLLAALDEGIYRLPTPTSGYPLARKRALEHREDVRVLALVVLALAAASLVLLLVQRGLLASEEAAAVLRLSGTEHAGVRRERLRMTVRVVGSALAVLLVFCAIALYLIVRGRAL